jgi:hypothetical protein
MLLALQLLNLLEADGSDIVVALTGAAVTASPGSLVPSATLSVSGLQISFSAGTLVAVGGQAGDNTTASRTVAVYGPYSVIFSA